MATTSSKNNVVEKPSVQDGDNEELIPPEKVCEMLGGISQSTLREWNNTHKHRKALAPIRFSHRVVRYRKQNVYNFIEKCQSVY